MPDNESRPARKSSSEVSSVEATKPAAFTLPFGPTMMPFRLTRKTWPLAATVPSIEDGSAPVTRLSSAEDENG